MERAYSVRGHWQFPLDMLRRDQARAASPEDQKLIDRMSGDESDPEFGTRTVVQINLIMEAGEPTPYLPNGRLTPNYERWESKGWTVIGVPEIDGWKALDAHIARAAAARASALAKLTPEDKEALGLTVYAVPHSSYPARIAQRNAQGYFGVTGAPEPNQLVWLRPSEIHGTPEIGAEGRLQYVSDGRSGLWHLYDATMPVPDVPTGETKES